SLTDTGIPVGFWRSVNNSYNAFVVEGFIDELANAAKKDPYEYRRDLLGKAPRHLRVLNLAASKAGWGTPLPTGRSRGIAVYKSSIAAAVHGAIVHGLTAAPGGESTTGTGRGEPTSSQASARDGRSEAPAVRALRVPRPGAQGGVPGSPTPPCASVLGTIWT